MTNATGRRPVALKELKAMGQWACVRFIRVIGLQGLGFTSYEVYKGYTVTGFRVYKL